VSAQRRAAAITPDTITVGGYFRVAVRIEVPPGMRIEFPDTLDVPEDVEAAARREMQVDTAMPGIATMTAVYTLAAWKTGTIELPPARLRLLTSRGEEIVEVGIPPVTVASVLPADTAGIEPMPVKDVLGAARALLPLVLLLLLLLLLAGLALWAWKRRRVEEPVLVATPGVPPRERALESLDRLLSSGLMERDLRTFYFMLTAIVRTYIGELNRDWGVDLTTAELRARMLAGLRLGGGQSDAQAAAFASRGMRLDALLGRADLIKFARQPAALQDATRDHEAARRWVREFDWPVRREERAA
jgi:hypothetical protein